MMRKVFSIALLACVFGLAQSAMAGVTIDIEFTASGTPTLDIPVTALPDAGPGCTFTGYYGTVIATGHCMDVILRTTDGLISLNASVAYESDNGLAVTQFNEWLGVGVAFDKQGAATKSCVNFDGVGDNGSQIGIFECQVPPPNGPPSVAPGTYKIGTIVWDTSGTTPGVETVSIVGVIVGAVINGVITDVSSSVVTGSHAINIIPEPGTASLLGLGLVGLILAGRRSRA
jgi:hypothetical protein